MFDLAILGGGPGGYVAAIRGAQRGLKVLLVEKDSLGGTCLNKGCVPTKCFVSDSKLFHSAVASSVLSGREQLGIDSEKMVARKRNVVDALRKGLRVLMRSNGIEVVEGRGRLLSSGRLSVEQRGVGESEVRARHIVLATGSRPAVPPSIQVDGRFVQTTDDMLDCKDIPRKIIILGGGVIGIEMAGIFLNLGCKVTLVEMLPDILWTEDEDVRKEMMRLLKERGAAVYVQTTCKKVTVREEKVETTIEGKDGTTAVLCSDRMLVATGRAPVLDGIDAAGLGLALDGLFVKVNAHMQTNLPGVYAIGDVVGGMMLAHKASAEAEVAVAHILGENKTLNPELIPRCIWGLEEVGAVGLTERQAWATGRPVKVGKFSFGNCGAGKANEKENGLAKIVGDAETGEILGVHILGARATDLIGESVVAKTMECAVEDLAEAIRPHPTFSEAVMEAAFDWHDAAIHSPRRAAR